MKKNEDIQKEGEWTDRKGNTLELFSCIGYFNQFDKEGNLIGGLWKGYENKIDRKFFIILNDKEEFTFFNDTILTIWKKHLLNDILPHQQRSDLYDSKKMLEEVEEEWKNENERS